MQIRFGKMDSKQELLERVLLMMNYDSSKTLNENTQLITEQYAWPSVLQQGLELSKTRAFSGPKWETYLNGLMATTLPDLMKIQKGFSDAGYGAISPDFGLQGFNKPNPTPASIVLENDIFVKSLRNYENRKAKGLNAGIKPTGPQSTLIPEVPVQMKNLFGKTSGQLLDERQKQKSDAQKKKTDLQKKKNEDELKASGCFFVNKQEGDAFRGWFNDTYPKLAQKNQLDRSGAFCNSFINKVANATFKEGINKGKKVYDVYLIVKSQKDATSNITNVNPTPEYDSKNQKKNFRNTLESPGKSYSEYEDVFDFSSFPIELPLTQYNKTTGDYGGYKFNYWTEPKTKIKVYIQGKTKDEVFIELIDLYDTQQENKKKDELITKVNNSPLINQLFSEKAINYALNNCDEEGVLSFFQEILDGTKKNKYGNIVGKYYKNSKGQSFMAKWDSEEIPCEDPFWKEYGVYIQLGGMLAIGILSGGLGLGPSAALFVELAADTALNLYSLKKSSEAQDPDAIKMDLAYVFLPLLMASGPVRAALKSAKFGDEVIESVESKLKSLPPNSTKTQVDDLFKNMTPQEQRVINELGKEEYKDVVQKASKDVMDGLKKTAKAKIGRKISNPLINILVYGAPAANYLVNQVNKMNEILKSRGKKTLTAQEQEIWAMALSFLNNQDRNEFTNSLNNLSDTDLNELVSNPKIQQAIQKQYYTETIKNEEDRKKSADEFIKDLRKIMEESAKKVEESNDEIELIVLDEPVIE
jgi:hypothetical protein